ncbi:hypothetical protein B0O99DRAFT_290979 [Bisporella sp. PMI_857]|nr:hypothetical protein B0O99DRAFT_290979 [Bisporella sp. PMI_857]
MARNGNGKNKSKRKATPLKGRAAKKAKDYSKYDDVDILEDDKCSLYSEETDLLAILSHPLAVETLVASSLECLPIHGADSEKFKTDMAAFKEDGRAGRFDKSWVTQALAASEKRSNGGFEEFQRQCFTSDWNLPLEEPKEVNSQPESRYRELDNSHDASGSCSSDERMPDAPRSTSEGQVGESNQPMSTGSAPSTHADESSQHMTVDSRTSDQARESERSQVNPTTNETTIRSSTEGFKEPCSS